MTILEALGTNAKIDVLDKGYVKYIGHMGSDESFVEAARMSTGKGFFDWYWDKDTYSNCYCGNCETHHLFETLPTEETANNDAFGVPLCTVCWAAQITMLGFNDTPELLGRKGEKRDLGLLEYLYSNRHSTPFEMGDLVIEVKAPIEVFRQWHRHRTQSYNEFSARYSQMPNDHYVPDSSRLAPQKSANKQANSTVLGGLVSTENLRDAMRLGIQDVQEKIYDQYEQLLESGVPKEVARINTPVSRYSKMRAKANVRNWLGFLGLRMDLHAQKEIREYANAVASIIKILYPRTFELFLEWDLMSERFSRTEMGFLRYLFGTVLGDDASKDIVAQRAHAWGMDQKQLKKLLNKLLADKPALYKEVLDNLDNV